GRFEPEGGQTHSQPPPPADPPGAGFDPSRPGGTPAADPRNADSLEPPATGTDGAITEIDPGSDPRAAVLADLNGRNPDFPGLREAAARGDLRTAADIIWQVLRQRRVVDAALAAGPRGSQRSAPAEAYQQAFSALEAPISGGGETPDMAAERLSRLLDAFGEPVLDDPAFGGAMERALVRLHADIATVRAALRADNYDPAWPRMAGAYVRAVAVCDFLVFPNRELATDVNAVAQKAGGLFYPDGASIAGDVAGVTGDLFRMALALDAHSREDAGFRRAISPLWRALERPTRHIRNLIQPDGGLPAFGPRGSRDLTPAELSRLGELFPPAGSRAARVGLAASRSFPALSGQESFGGVFASRDGGGDSRFLAVRFGPRGIMPGVPNHNDFGSLSLMAGNVGFIADAGGYDGEAAGGGAHSVLSLDGEYVSPAGGNEPGRPTETIWRTNAALDYAADRAYFADGGSWQRTLLYVKRLPGEGRGDYWLILDQVETGSGRPGQARVRFQFAPGIQVYDDGSGILATAGYGDGPALRLFALDAGSRTMVSNGTAFAGYGEDPSVGYLAAPAVDIERNLVGGGLATLLYPAENAGQRPLRLERDSDIISGRASAVVVDHGLDRLDVIAWAPPGSDLVTPTLNLQMSADLAVFRLRGGKFVRINFINLEHFQAKEPDGGVWSMRVAGPAQTLTLEPERNGGWQALSDPANAGSAALHEVNLGPAIAARRLNIRPGELRVIAR
ncbi:MAG: heparinase II/III-family protein, partial [Planctomycetota bacterium]|nr:heparinase II/III-family protein [Planctomycetota bacterium]